MRIGFRWGKSEGKRLFVTNHNSPMALPKKRRQCDKAYSVYSLQHPSAIHSSLLPSK